MAYNLFSTIKMRFGFNKRVKSASHKWRDFSFGIRENSKILFVSKNEKIIFFSIKRKCMILVKLFL